jgi:hypothetical protein
MFIDVMYSRIHLESVRLPRKFVSILYIPRVYLDKEKRKKEEPYGRPIQASTRLYIYVYVYVSIQISTLLRKKVNIVSIHTYLKANHPSYLSSHSSW